MTVSRKSFLGARPRAPNTANHDARLLYAIDLARLARLAGSSTSSRSTSPRTHRLQLYELLNSWRVVDAHYIAPRKDARDDHATRVRAVIDVNVIWHLASTNNKETVLKTFNFFDFGSPFVILATILVLSSQASAQGASGFAIKGGTELGGSLSFQSLAGNGLTTSSLFSFTPYVGYFVADGFELGFNPLGISIRSSGHTASTSLMVLAAPSYNFHTEGVAYPFIEALLGYTSNAVGNSQGGFSWGGRGGVKLAVTGNALLNLAVEYTQITTFSNVTNMFMVSAGFSVWL